MSEVAALLAEAERQHEAGQTEEAYQICSRLLRQDPENALALELTGVLASRLGDVETAVRMLERAALRRPGQARLLANLGAVYRAAGRLDEAEARYREALASDPEAVNARFNLANLLAFRGMASAALREYAAVLERQPLNAGALNNLAGLLKDKGRYAEAESAYRALIAAHPRDAAARSNLGALCMTLGRIEEAIALYRAAIAMNPKAPEPHNNLGVALLEAGSYVEAAECFAAARALGGATAEIHENSGNLQRKLGDTEHAARSYEKARALGGKGGVSFKLATLLPVVADSVAELVRWRQRMERAVGDLASAAPSLADPYAEAGVTAFNLSYHDTNNRDLQRTLAGAYLAACPSLAYTAPHCMAARRARRERLKVGLISRQFGANAVGWCYHGVLRNMPRDDISVTALRFGESDDPLWRSIAAEADATAILPASLDMARRRIAALELDALVYTDIGMDPLTYFLAFARLAPLQCVLAGHPDTVGIPNIDLFISSEMQEPPDAAGHYSERLVLLPGAPTYYARPSLPSPLKPRAAFGLPEAQALYFCAQTLIKVHPEMDALFRGVLDSDPDGILVLPSGYNARLAEHLRARFAASLGARAKRVRFLPAMSHLDFMNVMALADVSLDTRPFGGGNTSWQAIAAGTPVVTWPGRFLRGRYTQALYRLAGATDTVVDSGDVYVAMAVRLARDRAFRTEVQARIEAGSSRIFADMTHVEGMGEALLRFAKS
ncbi:MAG: tetratricopeptide repeat protein [Alphaproteobacteria bacterium]